jgi:hypothetical protein
MLGKLPVSCRVIGEVQALSPETIKSHEWQANGKPRKSVMRYSVAGVTYLVVNHPATHAEALKPSLVESYDTVGYAEPVITRMRARDISESIERAYEGALSA